MDNNISVIEGYYNVQKHLNEELIDFLKIYKYNSYTKYDNILKYIVILYNCGDKDKLDRLLLINRYIEANNILNTFIEDNDFLNIIKTYEAYMDKSKWTIEILNIGDKHLYGLKIDEFDENKESSITIGGTLYVDAKKTITLYYFDETLIINKFSTTPSSKFEAGYSKNKKIKFYIVKSFRYNGKDEKLFRIKFTTHRKKQKEYYCCAKIENVKNKEKFKFDIWYKNFKLKLKEWIQI